VNRSKLAIERGVLIEIVHNKSGLTRKWILSLPEQPVVAD
jgi:hypothetical protein